MTPTPSPPRLDQLRDALVAGIPQYEQRRRKVRRLVATSSAALLVVALGAVGVVAAGAGSGQDPDPDDVVAGQTTVTPTEADSSGVVLVATDHLGGIAVNDLGTGTQVTYSPGTHGVAETGELADAVLVDDYLVIWQPTGPTLVYPAGRSSDGRSRLLDGALEEAGRPVGSIGGVRQIAPTDDGDSIWILGGNDELAERPLELVDLATGEVRLSTTVPGPGRLVDVRGDDAVIHPAAGQPGVDVILVSPDGGTTTLEAPFGPTPVRFVTATPTHSLWLTGPEATGESPNALLLTIDDQGNTVQIPSPAGTGHWVPTGWPVTPSRYPTMRTLSADGSRLLIGLTDPANPDPNQPASRVVVVDLVNGTSEIVHEDAQLGTAFWAEDDQTAVAVSWRGEETQTVTVIDSDSGTVTPLGDAAPSQYGVIAAR